MDGTERVREMMRDGRIVIACERIRGGLIVPTGSLWPDECESRSPHARAMPGAWPCWAFTAIPIDGFGLACDEGECKTVSALIAMHRVEPGCR